MRPISPLRPAIPLRAAALLLAALSAATLAAPIPHSLVQSLHSPATARQAGTQLGYAVAVDGDRAVFGSPFDNLGGEESGIVAIHSASSGALLEQLVNPRPENGSHFGWSLAISGSLLAVGVPQDDTGANDAGIVCVYDLASSTPAVPLHILENPFPALNDNFGWSVAISGSRVIVGAPRGDSGTGDAGCAYIYDLESPSPTVPAVQLNNPDPAGKNFGYAVAASGDHLVIGAPQEGGAGDTGRAHVFALAATSPAPPLFSLADATPLTNDGFGRAVAISGAIIVVAAPQDDTGAENSGVAHVFDLGSQTPATSVSTLPNPAPALNDGFGSSLAMSGNRLALGNHLDDLGGNDSGRVHVFDLPTGAPAVLVISLDNPGPQPNDQFGYSVALSGTRLATAAPGDNTGVSDAGTAYLYELGSGTPGTPAHVINTPSPPSEEKFGNAVAIDGNLVVAGCYHEDKGNNSNSGSTFIYDISSSSPDLPILSLENPGPATNDYFGGAVAIAGDNVAVAAYQDDTGATNAGTVYLYNRISPTPTVPVLTIPNPSPQSQDQFGNAIAISGNLLVVGAAKNDSGAVADTGSAYVFNLSGSNPAVPVAILDNPAPLAGDQFGASVAISGTRVAIGSPGNDVNSAIDAGSIYIFDISSGTPAVPVAVIDNPAPAADDEFGHSVGISGLRVIAGCPYSDLGARDGGRAYVFDLASQPPSLPVMTLSNPDPNPEDYHGIAVAISGTRVVIGASDADFGALDSGTAYVHELASSTAMVPASTLDCLDHRAGDAFGHVVAIDGTNIVAGAPLADGNTFDRGAVHVFDPDPPQARLQVEQPPGTGLLAGAASVHFGDSPLGITTTNQDIILRNVGTDTLVISGINLVGGHTGDFALAGISLPLTLAVDEIAIVPVAFGPLDSGNRLAVLRVSSNSGTNNPFDITLTGQGLSAGSDSDGDGLNDVAELALAALGFDWQVDDAELLEILVAGGNATGLYSASQLQAMNPGTPLLPRDPGSGAFKLTIGAGKSVDLMNFELLPMSPPHVQINGQGALEFRFPAPEPKAFFRWEPR